LNLAPLSNETAHGLHLFCSDCLKRVAVTTPGSGLYLCKDYAFAILRNYVDLTGSTSPVSVDDLITDSLKKLRSTIFAILADVLIWIHKEIVAHSAGA